MSSLQQVNALHDFACCVQRKLGQSQLMQSARPSWYGSIPKDLDHMLLNLVFRLVSETFCNDIWLVSQLRLWKAKY